jgi:hypothetical protein
VVAVSFTIKETTDSLQDGDGDGGGCGWGGNLCQIVI